MDVQRKKGILEICVLAVLKKGPSYGYLIIRELERCVGISESTLYPILKRLEQSGSLETYRLEYNGRMRKYYQLTEDGQRKIDAFLDEWDELRTMYEFVAEQNAQEPEERVQMPEENARESEENAQMPEESVWVSETNTQMPETEGSGIFAAEDLEGDVMSAGRDTEDSRVSVDEGAEFADEDRESGEEEQR